MSSRKHVSGSEKRKKRERVDDLIESQKGATDKFFRTSSSSRNSLELAIVNIEQQPDENLDDGNDINEGFASSLTIAKGVASDMGIEPSFPIKRRVTRKKQFDENDDDEEILLAKKVFEVEYFLVMVDFANLSLRNRFEELKVFKNIFSFLLSSKS